MNSLFEPISFYARVPPFSLPSLEPADTAAAPHGTWPTPGGGAGRTGRAGEPLVHDRFELAWHAPLGEASAPDSVLVGVGCVVVNGVRSRGFWRADGHAVGVTPRQPGTTFIDLTDRRVLTNDALGVAVLSLDARRESSIAAAAPADGITREILQGPGVFVILTVLKSPHGPAETVVETLRVSDYGNKKGSALYGIEPLAGVSREDDADVLAAAGAGGPVLAARNGIAWCDWQLRTRHQLEVPGRPLGLAVDEQERAHLLTDDGGWRHLHLLDPTRGPVYDLELPVDDEPFDSRPLVTSSGLTILSSPHVLLAVDVHGKVAWRLDLSGPSPATVSSNGLVLLGGASLEAVTAQGRRISLWSPPAPIVTPPVLANDLIHVATNDEVYLLRPAS